MMQVGAVAFAPADPASLVPAPPSFAPLVTPLVLAGPLPRHDPARRPPSLSAAQLDAALDHLERIAIFFDTRWRIGPVRFGADTILSAFPGGEFASTAAAAYVALQSGALSLPDEMKRRLWRNVAIDLVFGSIPLVGTVLDTFFRANIRNVDTVLQY
jgi:hypothetical protein